MVNAGRALTAQWRRVAFDSDHGWLSPELLMGWPFLPLRALWQAGVFGKVSFAVLKCALTEKGYRDGKLDRRYCYKIQRVALS